MTDNPTKEIPKSIKSGTASIFGVDLQFHILSDGRRVIESNSIEKLFEALENPGVSEEINKQECEKLAKFIRGIV